MQFLQNIRTQDVTAPVTLIFNEESYEVSATNSRGKTVRQLFTDYGAILGADPARLTRYIINGEIVPDDTVVRAGESVRGVTTAENKGVF